MEIKKQRQNLPKGHFNSDGTSQGKQTGPVRPTADAYNTTKQQPSNEKRK